MKEVLHWMVVGFCFGVGFATGQAVYASVLHLLQGRK